MMDLHKHGVCELADAVRRGALTATEILEHHLDRIRKYNKDLGAFVFVDEKGSRQAALELDNRFKAGEDPGLLAGIPFGVKALEDVAGWPHTLASKIFADRLATTTSTQVHRLQQAGAIAVGLTASPELGSASWTSSLLYGVCRNPWDTTKTPGGSSGGSSCAVSAGLVPMATGSDSGGSLRIPAAYCGLFGFKGSFGLVARGPGYGGMSNVRCYGVITRAVRDTARVLDCIVGTDEHDPFSLPHPGPKFETELGKVDFKGMRVGWSDDLGIGPCDKDIIKASKNCAEELIDSAAWRNIDINLELPDPEQAWQVLSTPDVNGMFGPFLPERAAEIAPLIRQIASMASTLRTEDYGNAARLRDELVQALARMFEEIDLLFLPTVTCRPFAAEGPSPEIIAGREVSMLGSVVNTSVFNLSGHPAASVPITQLDGMPMGLQIVGRRHDDLRVLAAAAYIEEMKPWPLLAPGFMS